MPAATDEQCPAPRNFGATDCPKNAHLIPDWENLDEEVELSRRANATSIIDEGDLASLMRVAALSNRDFTADKQNTRVIYDEVKLGPQVVEDQSAKAALPEHLAKLPIPRRPPWNKAMTRQQVDDNEKEAFLTWRRGFVELEENYDIALTPFEKNLEFWRQLWRVVEKSDVVVQVVDARNPLLYQSDSLKDYVKEVGEHKINVMLFNKADLLPKRVREAWGKYLDNLDVRCFFFAARTEIEARLKEKQAEIIMEGDENAVGDGDGDGDGDGHEDEDEDEDEDEGGGSDRADDGDSGSAHHAASDMSKSATRTLEGGQVELDEMGRVIIHDIGDGSDSEEEEAGDLVDDTGRKRNTTKVLNASELLDELEALGWLASSNSGRKIMQDVRDPENRSVSSMSGVSGASSRHQTDYIMIGFVGYPNVGKSSTINALLGQKKVGVTSTPGKTKHFQTMIVSDSVMLCDCPGLVFPSVVSSRAEMVCGGILPLNALKDHISPMELLARRIPRAVFEETYNIVLPCKTAKGEPRSYVTWQVRRRAALP
jgi:large subunit GTPase 1